MNLVAVKEPALWKKAQEILAQLVGDNEDHLVEPAAIKERDWKAVVIFGRLRPKAAFDENFADRLTEEIKRRGHNQLLAINASGAENWIHGSNESKVLMGVDISDYTCFQVPVSKDWLTYYDQQLGMFDYLICPEDASFALLLHIDTMMVLVGPIDFLRTVLGKEPSEANQDFSDYINEIGMPEDMKAFYLAVLDEYQRI
jgi:hypothetical protein